MCVINTYVLAAIVTLQVLFAVGPNFVIQRAKT